MKVIVLKIYKLIRKYTRILLIKILSSIFLLFPQNRFKILVVVDSISGTTFTNNNPYLLLKYIEKQKAGYQLVQIKHLEVTSIKNLFHLCTSQALIISSFYPPSSFPTRLKVIISHYYIPFKLDNPSQEHANYLTDLFSKKSIFYIANGDYERNTLYGSFQIPETKFKKLGSPRREFLIRNKEPLDIQEFFQLDFKPSKVFLYAPTYRDKFVEPHLGYNQHLNQLSDILGYSQENLEEILVDNKAIFIIALHIYLDKDVETRVQARPMKNMYFLTRQLKLQKQLSIYDFFWSSDALITDYSSISFDYLLTDKPIIYNFYDLEEYRQYRGIAHEPIEDITAGEQVRTGVEFLKAIQNVINSQDLYQAKRKQVLDFVDEIDDKTQIMANIFNFIKDK